MVQAVLTAPQLEAISKGQRLDDVMLGVYTKYAQEMHAALSFFQRTGKNTQADRRTPSLPRGLLASGAHTRGDTPP